MRYGPRRLDFLARSAGGELASWERPRQLSIITIATKAKDRHRNPDAAYLFSRREPYDRLSASMALPHASLGRA
jgi:hypothetical protein